MLFSLKKLPRFSLFILVAIVGVYLINYLLDNPFPMGMLSSFSGSPVNHTLEEDAKELAGEKARTNPSLEDIVEAGKEIISPEDVMSEMYDTDGPIDGGEPMSEWGSSEDGAVASYAGTEVAPSVFPVSKVSADQLLPNDRDSVWAQTHPEVTEKLAEQDFLSGSFSVGINTQGSSLRNANYQLRSDPPIYKVGVGPWNNTTITDDTNRRPLEIGSC